MCCLMVPSLRPRAFPISLLLKPLQTNVAIFCSRDVRFPETLGFCVHSSGPGPVRILDDRRRPDPYFLELAPCLVDKFNSSRCIGSVPAGADIYFTPAF